MHDISICPKCHKPISIPTGLEPTASVRCPLCNEEYPLSEAFPPELIPVAAAKTPEIAWPAEIAIGPAGAHEAEHASGEEKHVNEATHVAGIAPIAISPRRGRPPKSALHTIIEVVTGGLAGCVVAYYLLAWWFGPELKSRGFPIFSYLPGITRLTAPLENPILKSIDGSELPKQSEPSKELPPALPRPQTTTELQPPAEKLNGGMQPDKPAPDESMPNDEPKSLRPKPGSAEYVGPRMPPTVGSDQLSKTLKEVDSVISAGKAGETISAQTYQALCRVGETVAFVNGDASDTSLIDHIEAAKALLEKVAARPGHGAELARMASKRINAKSGQDVGILLAGVVKSVSKQGRLFEATIQLAGRAEPVSVLSDEELPAKTGEQVFVLGVVVRAPDANLVGYSGTKPVVVWSGALVKRP